jgi:hypothetical protein
MGAVKTMAAFGVGVYVLAMALGHVGKTSNASSPGATGESAELKLISFRCEHSDSFITVDGEVKNVTAAPISDLMVNSSHYDANGTFVRTDSAMVKYQPLMPGQTSPFETIGSYNPVMSRCAVAFQRMFGGKVATSR